jgi:prolyl oligopeptidase PreP (S9A serine peptidase family)
MILDQPSSGRDAPVLARIETRAGHGVGKPTAKQIEEAECENRGQWTNLS